MSEEASATCVQRSTHARVFIHRYCWLCLSGRLQHRRGVALTAAVPRDSASSTPLSCWVWREAMRAVVAMIYECSRDGRLGHGMGGVATPQRRVQAGYDCLDGSQRRARATSQIRTAPHAHGRHKQALRADVDWSQTVLVAARGVTAKWQRGSRWASRCLVHLRSQTFPLTMQ